MRWCLSILSLIVLLTFGVELCASYGVGGIKDSGHLLCVLDDDDVEVKQGVERENLFPDFYDLGEAGMVVMIRVVKTDMVLSLEGAEILEIHPGVRWHRWLCRECC